MVSLACLYKMRMGDLADNVVNSIGEENRTGRDGKAVEKPHGVQTKPKTSLTDITLIHGPARKGVLRRFSYIRSGKTSDSRQQIARRIRAPPRPVP